jgi:hypothetical protein
MLSFKLFQNSFLCAAAIASASAITSVEKASAQSADSLPSEPSAVMQQISQNNLENTTAQGVTSVSQLSDVKPTDWAFTALQSLVERYGCIAGYPDRTFRGSRATSRYEFAAGLNACLDKINELLSAGLADKVSKEDLAALQKLQEEFAAELALIRGRVDALEAKTAQIEAQQFSVTTKLTGEAIISPRFIIAEDKRPDTSSIAKGTISSFDGPTAKNVTIGYRVRLNFNTSFTGKDLLLTRLEASNIPRFRLGTFTNQGALQPDNTSGDEGQNFLVGNPTGQVNNNTIRLDTLQYSFPLSDRLGARLIATGGKLDDFAPTLNPLDYGGAGLGAISEFGQRNAIYRQGIGGAGFGLDYKISDAIRLSLGYLGGNRTSSATGSNIPVVIPGPNPITLPPAGGGLFGGSYAAIAQLTFSPTKNIDLGLAYVRSYITTYDLLSIRPGPGGSVGSHNSDGPLGAGPYELNSYGFQGQFKLSPGFILGGWFGLSDVNAPSGGISPVTGEPLSRPGAKATIINWALTMAFPDLFKEGSLGGIVFGQTPKVTSSDGIEPAILTGGISGLPLTDNNAESFHIELFYRYPITKNISITPGVVIITNPEYTTKNATLVTGTVRFTFTF